MALWAGQVRWAWAHWEEMAPGLWGVYRLCARSVIKGNSRCWWDLGLWGTACALVLLGLICKAAVRSLVVILVSKPNVLGSRKGDFFEEVVLSRWTSCRWLCCWRCACSCLCSQPGRFSVHARSWGSPAALASVPAHGSYSTGAGWPLYKQVAPCLFCAWGVSYENRIWRLLAPASCPLCVPRAAEHCWAVKQAVGCVWGSAAK